MRRVLPAAIVIAALAWSCTAATLAKEDVELTASDGMKVSAFFLKGGQEKGPAVVLLHMLGRSKEDWEPILEEFLLPKTKCSYLAIDFRGHGKSIAKGQETLSWRSLSEADFQDMIKDVKAAVDYLRARDDVDGERIAIVGASIGANVAINYAVGDEKIKGVALLSGALDYRGVKTAKAIADYGLRPIFIAAAGEDAPAGANLDMMAAQAKGRKTIRVFPGNIHGTRLFGVHPVDEPLAKFLGTCLGQSE